jgi:signal transduction histidine kinase
VIAINLAAIAVYWRRARLASDAASFDLVPALIIVVFAELSFTLYASAYDTYNLIGHLLKVGAYYLLFRALFQTSVEHPYRELRRRHEQLAALSHTSLEVAASLDVDTVSGSVLGHCQQLTGAEMGFLGLSNGLGRLEVIAMRGIASGQCALRAQAVLFKEGTVLAAILLKGRPMRIADLSAEPGAVDVPPGHPPLRSLMGVPLLVKGSPVGLIALANKPGGFTAEDEGLVSALASQAAIAIENARLYAAERRLAELERSKVQELYQINRALNSSLGLSETLHAVVRSARELLKAEAAVALLVEADQSALRLAASAGTPAQANERAVPIAGTLAATVLASGKPLVGTDPAQWREASLLGLGAERRGTVLAAPLAVRGKLAGVLETHRRQDHAFTEEDVALLLSFADAAAVAVANAELYEQLRAEDEQLRELNRLKDEFISLASHELKSPLSSILGYAQLMLRKAKPDVGEDPAIKAWQAIVRQAERINSLVNQLLDVSRIQTGRLELNCQPTDLAALARGVVEQLAVTTDRHRLELEVPAEPVAGSWDPALLEQVLTNLVSNAIKYSPDGGLVTVRVFATSDIASLPGAGCLAGGPQWAVVAVADEGIGIPKEGLAQLFQRFYRAPNAARLRINGLGLGLYISQEIIALHGGRMWVVSEEGRGSEFLFCLPLA